jgi:hypothetical protein
VLFSVSARHGASSHEIAEVVIIVPRSNRQDRRGRSPAAQSEVPRVTPVRGFGAPRDVAPLPIARACGKVRGTVPSRRRTMADKPQARSTQFSRRTLLRGAVRAGATQSSARPRIGLRQRFPGGGRLPAAAERRQTLRQVRSVLPPNARKIIEGTSARRAGAGCSHRLRGNSR